MKYIITAVPLIFTFIPLCVGLIIGKTSKKEKVIILYKSTQQGISDTAGITNPTS